MRQLTEQEEKAMIDARKMFLPAESPNTDPGKIEAASLGFRRGFIAGLAYQQVKLDAYAAYVSGKITLAELDDAIRHN